MTFTWAFAFSNISIITYASIQSITENEIGLINPKLDDPVIYTTESGLEVKFGNLAVTSALAGGNEERKFATMTTGNLTGFPYFTTTSGSTTYYWVIIGRNSGISTNIINVSYDSLANWQTKVEQSPTYKDFFENTYENYSPAGELITNHNVLNNYTARKLESIYSNFSALKTNDSEIPSGCVLCISNNVTSNAMKWSTGWRDNAYAIYGDDGHAYNDARETCDKYYSSDSFGFGTNLSLLQSCVLKQYGVYHYGSSSTLTTTATLSQYFFPLGNNTTYDNFLWQTYLTANQVKTSYNVWARTSTAKDEGTHYITTDGETATCSGYATDGYIRPACVIKLA